MSDNCYWCGSSIRDGQHRRVDNGWVCGEKCKQEYENSKKSQSSSGGSSSGGCFIATSVYGNYDHPIVLDLREFRDNWLEKKNLGRKFIGWYYKKGPVLASWIDKTKTRKLFAQLFIVKPLHFFVKIFRLHK
jgi:hypothetical protein